MPEKYGSHEQATLFALMLARAEVGNPDLKKDYGIELRAAARDRLNKDGLIESRQVKRRYVHQITDDGIDWCVEQLGKVEAPDRSGPLPRLVFEVMHNLPRYLRWRDVDFAEMINRGSLESLIREAYQELSVKPAEWIRLARIRPRTEGVDRDAVDGVLLKMIKAGGANLAPDSNRKVLTDEDRGAAIRVGTEDKHLLLIEGS
jgi:DNA-binding PadR family transcriptional regulator